VAQESSDTRIGSCKIGFGDLQIEVRLSNGFIAVLRPQTLLFAGFGILEVEHAAEFAAVEGETVFRNLRLFRPKL
jgi:hypothetical protein